MENTVKRLGYILAIQAEIEAMKIANLERKEQGYVFAYDEAAFQEKAEELRTIASKHNDQL